MSGATPREVSFPGAAGDAVSALLVSSTAPAPHAGVLFLHWGFGDRTSFAAEALALAPYGATSLLVDAPGFGARKGPRMPVRDARVVRAYVEQLLGDLSLALTLLCDQPGVHGGRLAFIGHSLGATIAGAFLAAEPRVCAAALLTGHPELSRVWLAKPTAEAARELEAFDGVRTLGRSDAALFFQFATRDEFIPRDAAERYLGAAHAARREVGWYASDHALERDPLALRDRVRWLGARLGLERVADEALARVRLPRGQVWKYRAIKPLLALASRVAKPG